jgi:Fe-Mn family superoxide dismutase
MVLPRRSFLALLGAGVASLAVNDAFSTTHWAIAAEIAPGPFKLPPLPYAYNALQPHIDEQTMRIHHDKHHQVYVNNLNGAIAKYPQLADKTAEELIQNLKGLPEDIRTVVRNNGGGHVNHSMFWEIMGAQGGGEPTGAIAKAITENFGSFEAFKKAFNEAGLKQFGSGWAWLVRTSAGKLEVLSTPNQDTPLMKGIYPILGNDVWEHAYYLKYQNRRGEYLDAWWNVINWTAVNQRWQQALKFKMA